MRPAIKAILVIASSVVLIGTTNASLPDKESFVVPLSGSAVSSAAYPDGGTGDPDGEGVVRLTIDQSKRQVCYDFSLAGLSTPMMAHIHRGQPLKNGPTVVTLFTGMEEKLSDCVQWTNKQLGAIVADPSNYYVNVYTTEYPDGALRGQLSA